MTPYSKDSYRALLRRALELEYRFAGFDEGPQGRGRRLYLRHDVDFSLRMAVELAEINRTMGVQGTFCLLLRSQIYNLLSHWALEQVRAIRALGQRVALHYVAPATLPADDGDLAALIHADFEIVRGHIPDVDPAFSWHNPTAELIARGLHLSVPGLTNLSSEEFTRAIPYYSDSNMRHGVADFDRLIAGKEEAMHWLLHPLNWVAGGSTMLDVLATTWTYVIREREEEMRTNRAYAEALPHGMPETVVQGFAEQWSRACGSEQKPCEEERPALMSAHLSLTGLHPADFPILFRWINDREQVMLNAPYKPVMLREHQAWFDAVQRRPDGKIFAIRLKESGKLIGSCQLHGIRDIHRSAQLQIRIGEPGERGHGYGTEAVHLLLDCAFKSLDLQRVFLHVFSTNAAAIRLYEKIGFVREGVLRKAARVDGRWLDVVVMGILREEYVGR